VLQTVIWICFDMIVHPAVFISQTDHCWNLSLEFRQLYIQLYFSV